MSALSSDGEDELVTISQKRYEELLLIEFCQSLERPYLHTQSVSESTPAKSHFAEYLSSRSLYYGGTLEEAKERANKRTKWDVPKTMIHQTTQTERLARATLPE